MDASAIVKADVVSEPGSPALGRAVFNGVPELLLHRSVDAFDLTVEAGRSRSRADMSYATSFEELGEGQPELRSVVGLDAAEGEGEFAEQGGQGRQAAEVVRLAITQAAK